MKFIPPPAETDVLNLRLLARNGNLDSYPALAGAYRDILRSYCSYRSARGNAKAPAISVAINLPPALKPLLRNHYTHPPDSLKPFLLHLRKGTSPDVCPMCGSPKAGQLDHVFPKHDFPEFSIFSQNLVPACDCNVKRVTILLALGVTSVFFIHTSMLFFNNGWCAHELSLHHSSVTSALESLS